MSELLKNILPPVNLSFKEKKRMNLQKEAITAGAAGAVAAEEAVAAGEEVAPAHLPLPPRTPLSSDKKRPQAKSQARLQARPQASPPSQQRDSSEKSEMMSQLEKIIINYPVIINSKVYDNLYKLLDIIFNSIGINDDTQLGLYKVFSQLEYENKITTIFTKNNLIELTQQINALIAADTKFKELTEQITAVGAFSETILNEWNKLLFELAKTQGYILLAKIKQPDCTKLIESIKDAVTKKIEVINTIISTTRSTDAALDRKYLKYKKKYLNIIKI